MGIFEESPHQLVLSPDFHQPINKRYTGSHGALEKKFLVLNLGAYNPTEPY